MSLEKQTLGFWERLLKLKDKYGYWNLTKLVLFVSFAISCLYLAKNFGENYSFEHQKEIISEIMQENNQQMFIDHEEKIEQRKEIRPYVMEILKETVEKMNCGRAFILELHNGSNNMAGLPFLHGSMTYEVVSPGIEPVDEDYQNISLTRFAFCDYLHKHDLWYGTTEELLELDKKIGGRLLFNNATYMVITSIRTTSCEIGYYGFVYYDNNKANISERKNMEFILQSVQKLSKLLDKNPDYN